MPSFGLAAFRPTLIRIAPLGPNPPRARALPAFCSRVHADSPRQIRQITVHSGGWGKIVPPQRHFLHPSTSDVANLPRFAAPGRPRLAGQAAGTEAAAVPTPDLDQTCLVDGGE
jgi:hypothetical protein